MRVENVVLSDDGSILLYISDNDNPDAPEKVVCYAVKSGNSYTDMGRVDTAEDNILADTDDDYTLSPLRYSILNGF